MHHVQGQLLQALIELFDIIFDGLIIVSHGAPTGSVN